MSRATNASVPVTVLLPVHNGGPHLAQAVRSILAQSHEQLELLVVDDGSTDGTSDYLASLDDPRVRIVGQSNQGLVRALNHGLALASHELVARMDADDVSAPNRIELQLALLLANPRVAAVGCCYDVIDGDGTTLRREHTAAHPAYLRRQLYFRNVLPHAGMMFRRVAVADVGGYREVGPAEDYDLWCRLVQRHDVMSLADVLLQYRHSPTGISVTAGDRQRLCTKAVRETMHSDHPFPPVTAATVLTDGIDHADSFSAHCPDAVARYVFDHLWLGYLLARRRQWSAARAVATGTMILVARRPAGLGGIGLVLRSLLAAAGRRFGPPAAER